MVSNEVRALASQGPLPNDAEFWNTLFTFPHVDVVVSLGSPENGEKYHPFWEDKNVSNFVINVSKELESSDASGCRFIQRTIRITKREKEKQITHLFFENWPDKGVIPAEYLGTLIRLVKDYSLPFVHCSAGIGRTGVFLAVFLAYTQNISIYDAVKLLRDPHTGRYPYMVQTLEQYDLAHRTLVWLNS